MTSRISLAEPPVEALVHVPAPEMNVDRSQLDRIACLAYERQRAKIPAFIVSVDVPPYVELPEASREMLRLATQRTLESLVLLGWIDLNS